MMAPSRFFWIPPRPFSSLPQSHRGAEKTPIARQQIYCTITARTLLVLISLCLCDSVVFRSATGTILPTLSGCWSGLLQPLPRNNPDGTSRDRGLLCCLLWPHRGRNADGHRLEASSPSPLRSCRGWIDWSRSADRRFP